MQKNNSIIAGNLAKTAIIRSVNANRDCLSMRVITNEVYFDARGNEQQNTVGHDVVRYGKKGQFDSFVEQYLQKGMAVCAEGLTRIDFSGDNKEFMNVTIDTSADRGDISPLASVGMFLNEQRVSGYLSDDSVVRATKTGDCISFRVITSFQWGKEDHEVITTGFNVIQFGKKGAFDSLAKLLKKGAGVYTKGKTEKKINEFEGKKRLEHTINASYERVMITKYVTDKQAA